MCQEYLGKERERVKMYPCFYKVLDAVPLAGPRHADIVQLQLQSVLLEMVSSGATQT